MIFEAVQAVLPNNNQDWGMVTAICAVIGIGGAALSKSIESAVRKQLQQQDTRMDANFARKDVIEAQHKDHDNRLRMIEDHILPTISRRIHGD